MLSTSYKFLSNILTIQAKNSTQRAKTFPKTMHAYLKQRSGQEAVRVILDLIQNAQFTQTDLHILSADIDSAFDSASRDFLFTVLQKLNFPPNFLRQLTMLFNHNQIALHVNGHTLGLIKHQWPWTRWPTFSFTLQCNYTSPGTSTSTSNSECNPNHKAWHENPQHY